MNTPYVCLRCSRQLLRWKYQRRSTGFVSLGQLVGRDNDSSTTPQELPLASGDPMAIEKPRRKKRLTFARLYQEQRKPKGVDKVLETLFASNSENEQAVKRSRYSRTPKVQDANASAIERLQVERSIDDRLRELRNKLRRGTAPLQEIWRDCQILLGEKDWNRDDNVTIGAASILVDYSSTLVDTPRTVRVFRDILIAICQKQRFEINGRSYTPADAVKIYLKHGVMKPCWHHVLWCQLGHVLQLRYQYTDETLGAASDERIRALMGEILEIWSLYMGRSGLYPGSVSVPLSEDSNEVDDKDSTPDPSLSSLPEQLQKVPTNNITVAAAMTLDCLKVAGMAAPLPIMGLFDRFGQALERDRTIASRCLLYVGVSSEVTEKALEGWKSQNWPERAKILRPTKKFDKSHASKHPMDTSQMWRLDWSEKGRNTRIADLEKVSQRFDAESALILWRQFQAHLQGDKSENEADSIDQLYTRFLRTFWALRRHEPAIEVWNHMINSGRLPKQRHWNAMLTGCHFAGDVESLRRIWANMLRSGTPPDTNNWTTYIHGLIDGYKWEEGLKALEHLGRIWKSAPPLTSPDTAADKMTVGNTAGENQSTEKPKVDTVLRPDLSPVNAALSALIHIDKRSLLPRVLAWAQSHQIPLSTFTFNILLRPLVRHGSQAAIQAHLQQMANAKCNPDVVTFSIILNGLVANPTSTFHTLPPEAQESTITSILADMSRQGIEPNPFTYGTLLDGMLTPRSNELGHDHTPNVPAARTILAHMAARNIYPSPHIYTILIMHYFSRRPVPDLPAISSLWSSICHSGQTSRLDTMFYDRLIVGYSNLDEVEEALKFVRIMPKEGKSPGWRALIGVLKALVRAREWGWAAELVDDAEREGGLLRHGYGRRGGSRQQEEFWALVEELKERGLVGRADEER